MAAVSALVIHAGFAALVPLLLAFRDLPNPPEEAIPIEIVPSLPQEQSLPQEHKPTASAPPPPAPPPPIPSPAAAPKREDAPPPFVAAPPEAQRAASQPVRSTAAGPPPDPPASKDSGPPPGAPTVLTAEGGGFAVAPAAPEPVAAPPQAHSRSTAPSDTSTTLAEALPMDLSAFPSTFQAVLSGSGARTSLDYKGLVYGRIQRSHRAMEEARARHLRGQMIVSFSVDQQGHATDLKIAGSSGNPALDDLGLAMIREAEPFPPPPPGADQLFTPTFAVGEE